jgi:mono/diheme cytochrome c family protein
VVARLPPVLLTAVALACAGCGAGSSPTRAPSGAEVFARSCAACHSLIGNESLHRQGGDLAGYHLNRAQLALMTRSMPTRPLSRAEFDAVIDYVLRAQDEPVNGGG